MSLMSVNLSFWDRLVGRKVFTKTYRDDHFTFSHGQKVSIRSHLNITLSYKDEYTNYQAKFVIVRGDRKIFIDFYEHMIQEGLFVTPATILLPTDTYYLELKYKSKSGSINSQIESKNVITKL